MLGLRRQLKIIWNLIQEHFRRQLRILKRWEARSWHTDIGQYSFTVRKSKRFHFLTDLEWQCNLSLVYYNSLAA